MELKECDVSGDDIRDAVWLRMAEQYPVSVEPNWYDLAEEHWDEAVEWYAKENGYTLESVEERLTDC